MRDGLKCKSILTDDNRNCYICGRPASEVHHIYEGNGRRQISDDNNFTVPLCSECHTFGRNSVHFNKDFELLLKRRCQEKYEETHSREEFIKLIGQNYLGDDDDNY